MKNSKGTLFVVDDERVIATTLTSILQSFGYAVHGFVTLQQALEAAKSTEPDLLITDVVLSSEDGFTLAEQICAMHPDCQVLIMSGRNDAAALMAERQLNFGMLPKPCHPLELVAEVKRLIGSPGA